MSLIVLGSQQSFAQSVSAGAAAAVAAVADPAVAYDQFVAAGYGSATSSAADCGWSGVQSRAALAASAVAVAPNPGALWNQAIAAGYASAAASAPFCSSGAVIGMNMQMVRRMRQQWIAFQQWYARDKT
jgi:hypothetical protein